MPKPVRDHQAKPAAAKGKANKTTEQYYGVPAFEANVSQIDTTAAHPWAHLADHREVTDRAGSRQRW